MTATAAAAIRRPAAAVASPLRRRCGLVATVTAALVLAPIGASAAARSSHILTLTGSATEPAPAGDAARGPACLLRFSLRRLASTPSKRTADLRLEFADPREGRSGTLAGTVRLDLDDHGDIRRTMRVDGIGCDELRPLNLQFACTTGDGRCPAGTRIRLKNFDRLEIAEDVLVFD
jgi:hypothetical protein